MDARLIDQTDKYVVDSEEAAIGLIAHFRDNAAEKGYVLSKSGYTYKTKKAKGEIVDECWIVTVTKAIGGIWE